VADTFSVRANDDVQKRFKELAELKEFQNQNDFLEHVLTLYDAERISSRIPTLKGAADGIKALSDRIARIIIGAGETLDAVQDKAIAEMESKRLEMDQRIAGAESERDGFKIQVEMLQKQLDKKAMDLADSIEHEKQLDRMLDDKAALIDEYRLKIDSLEMVIAGQKQDIQAAELALADNAELKTQVNELKMCVMQLEADKQTLEADKVKAEADKATALNEQAAALRQEMNEQQAAHEQAFHEYEARSNAYMEREKRLMEQVRGLQSKTEEQQAVIAAALQANTQQDKQPVKARTRKGKETAAISAGTGELEQ